MDQSEDAVTAALLDWIAGPVAAANWWFYEELLTIG
jgi:hypothetical protein